MRDVLDPPAGAVKIAQLISTKHLDEPSRLHMTSRLYQLEPLNGLRVGLQAEVTGALRASRSEPALQYSLVAIGTLLAHFTEHPDYASIATSEPNAVRTVLQHHNHAIALLSQRLTASNHSATEVALHCCRLFINLEAIQCHYLAACRQLVHGLRIMHGRRAWPYVDDRGLFRPAERPRLPRVDVYILKLFLMPCPGLGAAPDTAPDAGSSDGIDPRDGRAQLVVLANETLSFLQASAVKAGTLSEFLARRRDLLRDVQRWEPALHGHGGHATMVNETSMFLLHQILRVILRFSLCSDADIATTIAPEIEELSRVASWLECSQARIK